MKTLSTMRLALAFLATTAAPLLAQPVPSPTEIIAKHVAAIGGAEALKSVTSVKQTGTMSMAAMGLSGESVALFTLPNKNSTKVNLSGIGEVETGTDGVVAWSINAMQGPRVLEAEELAQTKEGADFMGQMLLLPDRFSSIENEGTQDFAGEKAYKLKFVSKATGTVTHRFFSVASGLMIGTESTTVTAMGSIDARITFSGYKAFNGVKFPTMAETSIGPQVITMTTTNVEFNVVPAGAITIPESIKPMVKK